MSQHHSSFSASEFIRAWSRTSSSKFKFILLPLLDSSRHTERRLFRCWLGNGVIWPKDYVDSSDQPPFAFSSLLFIPLNMTLLANLAWPFVCGCLTKAKICLIPSSVHSFLSYRVANWVPLSDTRCLGIPKRHTIFSIRNVGLCERLYGQPTQLRSTWWNIQWRRWGTSFDIGLKGMTQNINFPSMKGSWTGDRLQVL